jgi:RNA polymerase sigma factor (TIGR02999 family)
LALVYDELRKLAAAKLAKEKPGQTLQATALVHEAYLRLVDVEKAQHWNSRGHFFGAAAEAMRRIMVENSRRKKSLKAGGDRQRVASAEIENGKEVDSLDLLALHEALLKLAEKDARKAKLVELRFFAGLTNAQAAEVLGISASTADEDWRYAKSWLGVELGAAGNVNY